MSNSTTDEVEAIRERFAMVHATRIGAAVLADVHVLLQAYDQLRADVAGLETRIESWRAECDALRGENRQILERAERIETAMSETTSRLTTEVGEVWEKAIAEVAQVRLKLWREYTDSQSVLLNMVVSEIYAALETARDAAQKKTPIEN